MSDDHKNVKYKRTGLVLNKKYLQYMIPAFFSAIGVSLSEFVDCMVVSNLLNSDAFAIVNLGSPIYLSVCLIFSVTGVGGSLLFAECLGNKDKEKANYYFTISTILSLLFGILLFVLLIIFHPILGDFFGCPNELRKDFNFYVYVQTFFVPVGIFLMHITCFLPIIGKPFLSMFFVLSANVLNIILDIVFIRECGMGCEGAAYGMLVSYIIVLIAMIFIWYYGKISLTFCRFKKIGHSVVDIIKKGIPAGSAQAGYMVTAIFCNYFMNLAFGLNGVIAKSLFFQLDSIISIVLAGIIDNNASFIAMLKGEGDYYGIRNLSKCIIVMIVLACSLFSIFFVLYLNYIVALYNIHDLEALDLINKLVRIYVLYYPLRCVLLVFRDIYNTLNRSLYAILLGILDKMVSIPVIGSILYIFCGGYGIIVAFPISMIVIFCLMAVINYSIVRKSNGKYSPFLLLDEEYPMKVLCSYSVNNLENVTDIGMWIGNSLAEKSLNPSIRDKMCLAAEEIGIYISNQCGTDTAVDFLVSTNGNDYILTCRSSGKPFFPIKSDSLELSPNELLLTEMFRIRNEYIFGLNSTSLMILGQKI